MPLFIQVLVRGIIILFTSILAFLGIAPEATILTVEEAEIKTEERREVTAETLQNIEKEEQTPIPTRPESTPTTDGEILEENLPLSNTNDIVPQITLPEPESDEDESINNAVVNIICTSRSGNKINLVTGSGTIISPNGVVLTNAHVAQFFLLKDYIKEDHMDCSLRRENIPTFGYKAELLHISSNWVNENYQQISLENPRGTGERDYALLLITENTNPTLSIPSSFPFIETNGSVDKNSIGEVVTVAGYPGVDTGQFNIDSSARLQIGTTFIDEVFTFDKNNSIDVFSTGITPIAKRGTSGGGVFRDGELIGLITTTGTNPNNNESYINALTISHVEEILKDSTGQSLEEFISKDLKTQVEIFNQYTASRYLDLIGPEFCKTENVTC